MRDVNEQEILFYSDKNFAPPSFNELLKKIHNSKNANSLTITNCNLTAAQALEIIKAVACNTGIVSLDLSKNQIGQGDRDAMLVIFNKLLEIEHLESLDLSHNNTVPDNAFGEFVFLILRFNCHLKTLKLTHNNLGERIFAHINNAKNLEELDLSYNWDSPNCPPRKLFEEIVYLKNLSDEHSRLRKLVIDSNYTGKYHFSPLNMKGGSPNFSTVFESDFCLTYLSFSGSQKIDDWERLNEFLTRNLYFQNDQDLWGAVHEEDNEKSLLLFQKALHVTEKAKQVGHPYAETKLAKINLALGQRYLHCLDFFSAWDYLYPLLPYYLEARIALAEYLLNADKSFLFGETSEVGQAKENMNKNTLNEEGSSLKINFEPRVLGALTLLSRVSGIDISSELLKNREGLLRRAICLINGLTDELPDLKSLIGKSYMLSYQDLLSFVANHDGKQLTELTSTILQPALFDFFESCPNIKKIEGVWSSELGVLDVGSLLHQDNCLQVSILEDTLCKKLQEHLKKLKLNGEGEIEKIILSDDFLVFEELPQKFLLTTQSGQLSNAEINLRGWFALKDNIAKEKERRKNELQKQIKELDQKFSEFIKNPNGRTLMDILNDYNAIGEGEAFDQQCRALENQLLESMKQSLYKGSVESFDALKNQYLLLVEDEQENENLDLKIKKMLLDCFEDYFKGDDKLNIELLGKLCTTEYKKAVVEKVWQRYNEIKKFAGTYMFRIEPKGELSDIYNQLVPLQIVVNLLEIYYLDVSQEELEQTLLQTCENRFKTDANQRCGIILTFEEIIDEYKTRYQRIRPNDNAYIEVIIKYFCAVAKQALEPLVKNSSFLTSLTDFFKDPSMNVPNRFFKIFTEHADQEPYFAFMCLFALLASKEEHFAKPAGAVLKILIRKEEKLKNILELFEKKIINELLLESRVEGVNEINKILSEIYVAIDTKKPFDKDLIERVNELLKPSLAQSQENKNKIPSRSHGGITNA